MKKTDKAVYEMWIATINIYRTQKQIIGENFFQKIDNSTQNLPNYFNT